ncbi:MAG TPA: PAS domain S-box protein [Burkholderiales bacterium]|nr:PAS domain S-box protein [Burkholderiales bacterium]
MIASGAVLSDCLDEIVHLVEADTPQLLCSILLIDESGKKFLRGAASSQIGDYTDAIVGESIGPRAGSCGTAAYRKQLVVVKDIATDPLWDGYRDLALYHNLRASWSHPIISPDEQLLGTLALYYREPREPDSRELEVIRSAASLAGIAIELTRTRKQFLETIERFQFVARATNDVMWDWDLGSQTMWWSEAYQSVFGYSGKDTGARRIESWTARIHGSDRGRVTMGIQALIDSGKQAWCDEYRFRRRDGSYAFIFDRGFVLRDASRKPIRMVGAMQDITARKAADEALRETEDRYRRLVDLSPEAIYIHQDMKYVYANRAGVRLMGATSAEELLGRSVLESSPPELHDTVRERIRTQLEEGGAAPVKELVALRLDGSKVDIEVSSAPFQYHGRAALQVIARDISDRKKAERNLAELQARYRQLVELSPDAIYIHQDGRLVFVNSACMRLLGAAGEEDLIGRPVLDIVRPEQREMVRERVRLLYEGKQDLPGQLQSLLRVDGRTVEVDIKSAPFTFEGRPAVQTVARDVGERIRTEEALRQFRAAMDLSPDLIMLIDRASMRFVDVNDTACRMLGYAREELLERGPQDMGSLSRRQLESAYDRVIRGDIVTATFESQYRRKDGSHLPVEVIRRSVPARDGHIVVVIARDLTERKIAEAQSRKAEEHTRRILSSITDAFFAVDRDWRVTYLNATAEKLLRRRAVELLGRNLWDEFPEARGTKFEVSHRQAMEENVRVKFEEYYAPLETWFEVHSYPYEDGLSVYFRDITERKRTEERLSYLAQYDTLTGLPNRALFRDRLEQAVSRARRDNSLLAVLFLDLDRFKDINDNLGHSVGDELLVQVAARLRKALRDIDTIARLAGDEFTFIVEGATRAEQVTSVADKLLAALRQPARVGGQEVYVSGSIGIALTSSGTETVEELLKYADIAMYHAKSEGRNNYQVYSEALHAKSSEKLGLEARLRHAIEREEFVLFYQPQIDIRTGVIVGAEALIRWQSPELGMVAPNRFIPLAEETGLIVPIGEWVIRTACRQGKAWREGGHSRISMAVNLSPRQFRQRDLLDTIERIIGEHQVDARRLELEITETTIMHRAEEVTAMLVRLDQIGVRLAIDDFGTGYSSLSYLKRFPVHKLKIDQSFVRDLTAHSDDAAIVAAIVAMARSLGLAVIAEGVETHEQLDFLRKIECDEYQGYLFSKPVPAADFAKLLEKNARHAGRPAGDDATPPRRRKPTRERR